ncbi:MAG TPA: cbb3-type cytochrome c oxidase subunit I [Candidatus Limnocylindria bacterium]|jgi:cytochrome c oxidase subunit 1|nr:cbb3-type cytochrome c oxidase subunit I [Candidatus Limnocylindria bacterium]
MTSMTAAEDAVLRDPARVRTVNRLTLLWVITGFVLLLILGLAGLLMRAMQSGVLGNVALIWFYPILTLHGIGMVALVALVPLAGCWYIFASKVPMSTRLWQICYVATVLAVVLVLISTLIGKFGTGWTFLYPLPYNSTGAWPVWSFVPFLLAVTIVVLVVLAIDVEFLYRGIRKYGSLGRMYGLEYLVDPHPADDGRPRTDLATIAMTTTALTWIPAALLGAVIVILELIQVFVPDFSISALLAKNLTFFAGHMLVNVGLYMAAALLYTILPVFAKRPWKVARYVVIGWLATTVALWFAFYHHLYQDFAQPDAVQVVGEIFSYVSAFPALVVTLFGGAMLVWRSGIRWSPAPLFLYMGMAGWAIGGTGAILDSTAGLNQYMHNTLWVAGHFHGIMAMGVMMFFLGTLYYVYPVLSGRALSERVGRAAAGFIGVGGWTVVLIFFLSGVLSEPRRYAVQLPGTEWLALVGMLGAILVGIGGLLIAGDLARSIRRPVPVPGEQEPVEPEPAPVPAPA